MKQELTLSNLLNQTFTELGDNAKLFAIFLAIMVPINGVLGWAEAGSASSSFDFGPGAFAITENLLAFGAGIVAVIIAGYLASIALTYWFYAALMARNPSPGFGRFWPWLGIYILAALGIGFGLVLLIVPGLILIVRWVLVLPLVIEGKVPAMDTFGESWARTRGYGWPIFGAMVIVFIGLMVVGGMIGGSAALLGGIASIPAIAASAIVDTVFSAVFMALAVGAYRLSGDDTEELADVFS